MAFAFFGETLKWSRRSWFHEPFAKQRKFLWFKANLQSLIQFHKLKSPSYRAYESSSLAGNYFFFKWEKNAHYQLGLAGSYFFPKLEKNGRYPVPIPDPHFTRGWWGREETNQDSLAVISSPNERKMADALSPSQIQILLGDGKAEKKPIRTRWQLFLP